MKNKYVVLNCPSYIDRPLSNHNMVCYEQDKTMPNRDTLYGYCYNCSDCLVKKAIDKATQQGNTEMLSLFETKLLDDIIKTIDN